MKILLLTTAYQAYLNNFYKKRPVLNTKTYIEQKAELEYDAFGWADFWNNALESFGYEVIELLANAEPLQKTWAIEHGRTYDERNWILEIARDQVIHEKPDILFMVEYYIFTDKWIKEIRERCPSIKLVLGWCGAPYANPNIFTAYDLVLSCIPELVDHFLNLGHKSKHLNHAFDPRILDRIDLTRKPAFDFSFAGQIIRANKFHLEREKILENLTKHFNMQIFIPRTGTSYDELKVLVRIILFGSGKLLNKMGMPQKTIKNIPLLNKYLSLSNSPKFTVNRKLKPYLLPGLFGLEMFQVLKDSHLTFNSHIDVSPRSASNMRLFEATGVGTCLVTDWKENIHDLFEPDREVVTYKSVDECVEKVRWLLDHPEERKKIAVAGQKRTLQEHTFVQRATRLDDIIKQEFKLRKIQ